MTAFSKKIESLQNPLVKYIVKLRENPHFRKKENALFVSGKKLIADLAKIVTPKRIFFYEKEKDLPLCLEKIEVSLNVLKKMTNQPSPDNLAAEFPLPHDSSLQKCSSIVAFDHISDPGNLGTLLRSALAFGWEGIFFLPNTVDPFHEKVIRASQGALFQLQWKEGAWEELEMLKKQNNFSAYVADLEGTPLPEVISKEKKLLLLSHEATGVSKKGETFGEKITIPMSGKMESLNVAVAGSILMYGLSDLRKKK